MAINYPTSLDSMGTAVYRDVIREEHMNDVRRACEALQGQVGVTNSSVVTSLRYLAQNLRPTTLDGAIRYVGPNSTYTTITAGLAAAQSGETVLVLPGIYAESNLTLPNNVNLVGCGWASDIAASDNSNAIVNCAGDNIISNIKIRNTVASGNGTAGIVIDSNTDEIYLKDCYIAGTSDSIISSHKGHLFVQRCVLDTKWDTINCSSGTTIVNDCLIKGFLDNANTSGVFYPSASNGGGTFIVTNNFIDLSCQVGLSNQTSYIKLIGIGNLSQTLTDYTSLTYNAATDSTTMVDEENYAFRPQDLGQTVAFTPSTDSGTIIKWVSPSEVEISGNVTGGAVGYTQHTITKQERIYSSGNIIKINGQDRDCNGIDFFTLAQNYVIHSIGDYFELSSSGTVNAINRANGGNQYNIYNGNLLEYGLGGSGDTVNGPIVTESATNNLGFFGTDPVAQQTGVAETAEGIHAALVNLGLITA